jgi:hypothetical protein
MAATLEHLFSVRKAALSDGTFLPVAHGFVSECGVVVENTQSDEPNCRESARNRGWSTVYQRLNCQGREHSGDTL